MYFTEKENFQRIFKDLADFYTEIHLFLKEAGKKPNQTKTYTNLRQSCTKAAYKVKKGGEVNPGCRGRAEGFKNLAQKGC